MRRLASIAQPGRLVICTLAVLLVLAALPDGRSLADPQQPERPAFRPGAVVVKFRPQARVPEVLAQYALAERKAIPKLRLRLLKVPEGREREYAGILARRADVEYAGLDNRVRIVGSPPNDPYYSNQWALPLVRVTQGWDLAMGNGVTVAVIDTGVQLNHPDLAANLVAGYNFVDWDHAYDPLPPCRPGLPYNPNDPSDDHGHGTHVAGIAAAVTNNGTGVAGMAPGARIMPLKVLSCYGEGYYSDVADAVVYGADHGAKVLNLSLGGDEYDPGLQDAVDYATGHGSLVVAAAGNSSSSTPFYPAGYSNSLAVGATNSLDQRASFSNYGDWVDVAAPGVSIWSTYLGSSYGSMQGTSMSTPYVAGLAALLFSDSTAPSRAQVRQAIEGTGPQLSPGEWGRSTPLRRIDARSALEAIHPPVLQVSRTQVLFLSDQTQAPVSQTLTVTNVGGGAINWTTSTSPSAPWLSVQPTSGSAPATVVLQANPLQVSGPGVYVTTLSVNGGTGVQNSPQQVEVRYSVVSELRRNYLPRVAR